VSTPSITWKRSGKPGRFFLVKIPEEMPETIPEEMPETKKIGEPAKAPHV